MFQQLINCLCAERKLGDGYRLIGKWYGHRHRLHGRWGGQERRGAEGDVGRGSCPYLAARRSRLPSSTPLLPVPFLLSVLLPPSIKYQTENQAHDTTTARWTFRSGKFNRMASLFFPSTGLPLLYGTPHLFMDGWDMLQLIEWASYGEGILGRGTGRSGTGGQVA